MSNIHRISDLPDTNRDQRIARANPSFQSGFGLPAILTNPVNEGFCNMLHVSLIPSLKFKSSTVLLIALSTSLYIITIMHTPLGQMFLSPSVETLLDFGLLNQKLLKQKKLWALVTAMFMNQNILYFFINQFNLLLLAGNIEQIIKPKATLFTFTMSGIVGGIIILIISDKYMYNTTSYQALLGILGAAISFFIVNWYSIDTTGIDKSKMMCYFGFFSILFVFFGQVNLIYPNLACLFTGIFFGLWTIEPIVNTGYESKCKLLGIISSTFIIIISIILLYNYSV